MTDKTTAVARGAGHRKGSDELAALDADLRQDPHQPRLVSRRITLLRQMGREAEALAYAETLPEALKGGKLIHLVVGLLAGAGRLEEAEALVTRASDVTRALPGYKLAAVRLARRRYGPGEALALCQQLGSDNGPVGLMREEAELLIALGRSAEAVAVMVRALEVGQDAGLVQLALRHSLDIGEIGLARQVLDRHGDVLAGQGWLPYFTARAHEAAGETALAGGVAAEGAGRFPDHLQLHQLHWTLLQADGLREDAIAAATRFAQANPGNQRALSQAVQFLNRLGAGAEVDAILARAGALDLDNAAAFIARAEVMALRKDAFGVRALLEGMPAPMRDDPTLQIKLAQAEAMTDALPQAIARLHPLTQPPVQASNARLNAAQFCVRLGRFDDARAYLDGLEPALHDAPRLARLFMIQAQAEAQQGRPGPAHALALKAILATPEAEPAWNLRTRYALLLGRLDEAWDSHVEATRIGRAVNMKGNRQNKTNASHHGQMVNEYRLHLAGEDLGLCSADAPQDAAMAHFKARVDAAPGATPLAICLFSAQFRAGRTGGAAPTVTGQARIPRKLFQYWDKPEAPPQVEALFRRNAALNPDFAYRRFDRSSALRFLQERGEEAALRAVRLAPHAAAQSDLIRLALLWHEGGVYMDADDVCLTPLSQSLPMGLRLAGVLEDWMSVGNNFIAVGPRDPIIRAALDDAAGAFAGTNGESIWLATGPGAMTRALARHGVTAEGELCAGIWLRSLPQLRADVAPHIVLSYKDTSDHWMDLGRRVPGKTRALRRLQRA
ncbi:MAG: hypothetical protein CML68_02980 [Rhodobacteraceae bacterium]|nr:hypothetical protein [Paracoccaceae bacterium]